MNVIDKAKARLARAGVNQWQSGYPQGSDIEEDIHKGQAYVLIVNQEVIGYMAIVYSKIENEQGRFMEIATLKRMALHDHSVKKGLSNLFQEFFEKQARARQFQTIRIDTLGENQAMMAFIKRHGYQYIGEIEVRVGEFRMNFEKQLT